MNTAVLPGIKVCVFDAYGTLFDISSVARGAQDVLGHKWIAFSEMWRMKQLQYAWLRSLSGNYADYWQVTRDALDFTMDTLGFEDEALRDRLMDLFLEILAYPEVPETLKLLKKQGIKMSILSNGSPKMISSALKSNQLGGFFEHVISVDEIGRFKPHPSAYQLVVDRMKRPLEQVCLLTSNGWDAYSAKAFGFKVLWCNRFDQMPEHIPQTPDGVIDSLSTLPDCLIAE